MTIGEKIKQRREELGYSQKELAELAGMTNATIGNIETNQPCNLQTLERICKELKMRVQLVVDDDDADEVFMVSSDELEYDVRKCVKQLDKVKRTLEELVK